ncbi:MAG: glycosyltransferase family 39 protein [Candidatus Omnitrophota bacterium]
MRLSKTYSTDDKFVLNLFLWAFIARAALLVIISFVLVYYDRILTYPKYPGWAPNLIGDASYYTLRGYWMALDWSGYPLSQKILKSAYNPIYGWNGYTYLLAFFHKIFGFSPISSTLLNCLFGSLIGTFSYLIAREYLSIKVARLTAVMVSFFPSLFLWSITNLKDTFMILCIVFILWAFIRFNSVSGRGKLVFLSFIVAGLLALATLRKGVGFLMPIVLASSYLISLKKPSVFLKLLAVAGVILYLLLPGKDMLQKFDYMVHKSVYRLLAMHQATVPIKGSSYKILDEKYYLHNPEFHPYTSPDEEYYAYPTIKLGYLQYARIYLRAMTHFLFEPYIWKLDSKLKLLSLTQMFFWYPLLSFALLGLFILMRYLSGQYLILFIYFLTMSFMIAMSQGNVGTLFRFRDLLTPVILLWSSVGIAKVLGWKILNSKNNLRFR